MMRGARSASELGIRPSNRSGGSMRWSSTETMRYRTSGTTAAVGLVIRRERRSASGGAVGGGLRGRGTPYQRQGLGLADPGGVVHLSARSDRVVGDAGVELLEGDSELEAG